MPRIRLLVPVAGHLADGIPAPGVFTPVDVDDATAEAWCDGERAELVPADPGTADAVAAAVERTNADAQSYLEAVLSQHAAEVADLRAQLAAAQTKPAKTPRKPAADKPTPAATPEASTEPPA